FIERTQITPEKRKKMSLEKEYYIGQIGGKPTYAKESPYKTIHDYIPDDKDFGIEQEKIAADILKTEKGIDYLTENIATAKDVLPQLKTSLKTIQDAPAGSLFYLGTDTEKTYKKSELIPL
ncbi:unnamed protein product, partial [marine sediment metagenome]